MNGNDAIVSRRMLDGLFIFQIVLNVVALAAVAGLLYVSTARIGDVSTAQNEAIKVQNEAQLCAQHDIILAVKAIGTKLGLHTDDIVVPDTSGLNCTSAQTTMAAALAELRRAATPCTIDGTVGDDDLSGTRGHDVICARRGDDYANGKAAGDVVRGGGGGDTLVGGNGPDTVYGLKGRDLIFVVDQQGDDHVYGGAGFDKCYGDKGDVFVSCEKVARV